MTIRTGFQLLLERRTLKALEFSVRNVARTSMVGCLTGMAMPAIALAQAQTQAQYPAKPIRMIVPYPPGAGTDFTARALGERITETLGQPVVIDSRPGAAATLDHGLVAKAPPDGYTLLLATTGGMVSGPALGLKITYDPVKDFAPIGLATYVPYSLVTFGGLPPNNMREFIALAKTQPGKLNFGSSGTGTPNHLGGELLMKMTGITMLHVPYKAGPRRWACRRRSFRNSMVSSTRHWRHRPSPSISLTMDWNPRAQRRPRFRN